MSSVLSRLAAKAKPAGILGSIEDPMVMARLGTYTTLAASADSGAFVVLFFYYGETVAGWATLILSTSFAVGLTLMLMTLAFNIGGYLLRKRYREAY